MPEVMKTVGRYEILREVGRGGMAMVYLARQTDLDRFVALKELGAFHASDPSFAQRFLRESRVAGSLSHPNIVTVHDYFEHDGTPYIAMEYVERGSLRPYVGRMNLAQIGGVLEGLLAGLTHAEAQGIVHRDLKPENLMVTADGRVKIADFGIAKATTKMQTGAFLTATGTTVGTPTYMAPEQAMAQDIGPWTDLYSVGCMAFELFTGNVPFHDSDAPMAILLRHVNEPIAPVKSHPARRSTRGSRTGSSALLVKEPDAAHAERQRRVGRLRGDPAHAARPALAPRGAAGRDAAEQDADGAKPLTPAPFPGTTAGDAASEEFKSFAWGAPASDTGPSAAPPMYTPPPSESTPSIPEPVVGPPTPMPSQAVPAPPAAGPRADRRRRGFVTFGTPAPPPPTDALIAAARGRRARGRPTPSAGADAARGRGRPDRLRHVPGLGTPRARRGVLRAARRPHAAAASPPPRRSRPTSRRRPRARRRASRSRDAAAGRGRRAGSGARAARRPAPRRSPERRPLVAATLMPQRAAGAADEAAEAAAAAHGRRPRLEPQVGRARGDRRRRRASSRVVGALALGGGGGERATAATRRRRRPRPRPARPSRSRPRASRCKVPAGWSGHAASAPAGARPRDGAVDASAARRARSIAFGMADKTAANSTLLPDDLRTGERAREADRRPRRRHPGRALRRRQDRRQDRHASSRSRPPRASPRSPAPPRPRPARRSPRRCGSPRASASRSARARTTPRTSSDASAGSSRARSPRPASSTTPASARRRSRRRAALAAAYTRRRRARCDRLKVSPADALRQRAARRRAARRRRGLQEGREPRAAPRTATATSSRAAKALAVRGDMKTRARRPGRRRATSCRPGARQTPRRSRACRR